MKTGTFILSAMLCVAPAFSGLSARADESKAMGLSEEDKAKIQADLRAAQDLLKNCNDAACLKALKSTIGAINDHMLCVGEGGHGGGRPCGNQGGGSNTGNNVGNTGNNNSNNGDRGENRR